MLYEIQKKRINQSLSSACQQGFASLYLVRLNIPQIRRCQSSVALLDPDLLVHPFLNVHNFGLDLLELTGVRTLTLG